MSSQHFDNFITLIKNQINGFYFSCFAKISIRASVLTIPEIGGNDLTNGKCPQRSEAKEPPSSQWWIWRSQSYRQVWKVKHNKTGSKHPNQGMQLYDAKISYQWNKKVKKKTKMSSKEFLYASCMKVSTLNFSKQDAGKPELDFVCYANTTEGNLTLGWWRGESGLMMDSIFSFELYVNGEKLRSCSVSEVIIPWLPCISISQSGWESYLSIYFPDSNCLYLSKKLYHNILFIDEVEAEVYLMYTITWI